MVIVTNRTIIVTLTSTGKEIEIIDRINGENGCTNNIEE